MEVSQWKKLPGSSGLWAGWLGLVAHLLHVFGTYLLWNLFLFFF